MKKYSRYLLFLGLVAVSYFIGGGCSFVTASDTSKEEDVTKRVEITPKGMQTVIVGKEYKFTANALREDGSIIAGKSVTETKTFTTTGKQSFSMAVDGLFAETTVNVIEEDIALPVEYRGKTYAGIDTMTVTGSVANKCPDASYRKLAVTCPEGNSFDADGFFPLKLAVNNPSMHQFIAVRISGGTNSEEEFYAYRGNPISGELETRIWLRWGKGSYTVKVYDAVEVTWNYQAVDGTTSADRTVTYYGDNVVGIRYYANPSVTFTVRNTREEDGTFLYPSSVIQSDDITVMNKAADLTAGLTGTTAKIKAIHDWIVTSKYYDQDSLIPGKRKRQDALAVMEYGMCVCEGYANLTAALLRNCGIQVKFISSSSLNHAWNHVNVGTETNPDWRLLDSCWDDPILLDSNGNYYDGNPYYISYENYLLKNLEGGSSPHTGGIPDIGRTAYSGIGHIDGVASVAY